MRAVVTRVKEAKVIIAGETVGAIERGLLILLGVGPEDNGDTARYLARKICGLRIFPDAAGKMNLDLAQAEGDLLVVSQFTLYADLKSRRPGFSGAAEPKTAERLYEEFMVACREQGFKVEHGLFGADMRVFSVNDGPVTLCLDTEGKV